MSGSDTNDDDRIADLGDVQDRAGRDEQEGDEQRSEEQDEGAVVRRALGRDLGDGRGALRLGDASAGLGPRGGPAAAAVGPLVFFVVDDRLMEVLLVLLRVPPTAGEQERHDRDRDRHGRDHQDQPEDQHLAERHTEKSGEGEGADTGNHQHDAALQADGEGGGHACGPDPADLRCEVAGERGGDDEQDVEEDGLQQRRDRQRHRIRHSFRPEHAQKCSDQALDRAHFFQHGAHQDAEGDQKSHFGHDVAETGADDFHRFGRAESRRESEVGGSDDQ